MPACCPTTVYLPLRESCHRRCRSHMPRGARPAAPAPPPGRYPSLPIDRNSRSDLLASSLVDTTLQRAGREKICRTALGGACDAQQELLHRPVEQCRIVQVGNVARPGDDRQLRAGDLALDDEGGDGYPVQSLSPRGKLYDVRTRAGNPVRRPALQDERPHHARPFEGQLQGEQRPVGAAAGVGGIYPEVVQQAAQVVAPELPGVTLAGVAGAPAAAPVPEDHAPAPRELAGVRQPVAGVRPATVGEHQRDALAVLLVVEAGPVHLSVRHEGPPARRPATSRGRRTTAPGNAAPPARTP